MILSMYHTAYHRKSPERNLPVHKMQRKLGVWGCPIWPHPSPRCRVLAGFLDSISAFVERLHGPLTLWQSNMAMENLRTEWRFLARKITDFNGPFSSKPCLITGGYFWTHSCGQIYDHLPSRRHWNAGFVNQSHLPKSKKWHPQRNAPDIATGKSVSGGLLQIMLFSIEETHDQS